MAKKAVKRAKKVSKKRKTSKAKQARAPKEIVVPTYLAPGESYEMGLHDVVRALKVIEKHGHLGKLVQQSKKDSKPVLVPAVTVNFVKDFMVRYRMYKDPVGKHIVNAHIDHSPPAGAESMRARDRFGGCNFGRN